MLTNTTVYSKEEDNKKVADNRQCDVSFNVDLCHLFLKCPNTRNTIKQIEFSFIDT